MPSNLKAQNLRDSAVYRTADLPWIRVPIILPVIGLGYAVYWDLRNTWTGSQNPKGEKEGERGVEDIAEDEEFKNYY
jgi:hypothetical protein